MVPLVPGGVFRRPLEGKDASITDFIAYPRHGLAWVTGASSDIGRALAKRQGFEITFPRRFTYGLELLRLLPYGLYFPLVSRRPAGAAADPAEPTAPVSEPMV